MTSWPIPLSQLATIASGEVIGDADRLVLGVCSLEHLVENHIAFVTATKNITNILTSETSFFIVKPPLVASVTQGIIHNNPQQAFRLILNHTHEKTTQAESGIADTAVISSKANIDNSASVGDYTVIEADVTIAPGCRIGSHCHLGAGTSIQAHTHIGHRVIIHSQTIIGEACVIGDGAVIASAGFGFSFEGGNWYSMPQIGRVQIGHHTHIGANSCIDRGAINDTTIGNNVIIDNLVHIAHNVVIGDHSAIAAGVGIAGSTRIGKYCMLGGKVGVVGHIEIADGVQVTGGSRVLKGIDKAGTYGGSFHVLPVMKWNRLTIYMKRLGQLFTKENDFEKPDECA